MAESHSSTQEQGVLVKASFEVAVKSVLPTSVWHPEQGLQFVVDNTFSPMVLSPARWGADIIVHSLTKFISGASDIVAGAGSPTRTPHTLLWPADLPGGGGALEHAPAVQRPRGSTTPTCRAGP